MDNNKIAIFVHGADEKTFREILKNLRTLEIPANFSVAVSNLQGEEKFQAYNVAMKKSDAKYKIYLDKNVVILQRNVLPKVIETFQADEKIAAVSLSGAVQLSTHGICLTSAKRVGKVFCGSEKIFNDDIIGGG